MKTPFIVSPDGYFFETRIKLDFEKLEAAGCSLFKSQFNMYDFLIEKYGYELDEIENFDMVIVDNERFRDWIGHYGEISGPVENFIIDFCL